MRRAALELRALRASAPAACSRVDWSRDQTRKVTAYDIFNGDADGLCALRQLRLHEPRDAVLVTGVKRDVALLSRVQPRAGDQLTVLDVSLHENRQPLLRALAAGAACTWFDHHFPGDIPAHPRLAAHIRYAPDTCTSLIVDAVLEGRYRAWAVAAAFGDNLPQAARHAAQPLGLTPERLELLRELGDLLNYNAYGESVEELYFHPAALYERLCRFLDPLEFVEQDPAFATLKHGYRSDIARAEQVRPEVDTEAHLAVVLPDAAWARRVIGPWANVVANRTPRRAHAVLVRRGDGLMVSIRAPVAQPVGADALARRFPTGGGRPGAAGINRLPESELTHFLAAFQEAFTGAEG
jgi:hypothetical protein